MKCLNPIWYGLSRAIKVFFMPAPQISKTTCGYQLKFGTNMQLPDLI